MPQQKLLPVPQLFYLLLLPVVLLFPVSGRSQAKGQGYTLKQAIDYALLKNASVKNALLDVDASKAKIGEVISSGLPQVNAGVNYSHNIQIQNVVLENGASAIASSTSLPKGAVIAFPFQLYNVGFGAITLNQMIFNGTFLVGLKAAETYKELSTKALKASKITVASNVSKAYYGVLVTDERISLLEKTINRLDSTYRETKEMFKNGFVEKIDVDRVEVALNNLKSEQLTAQRTREVTVTLLKFQMGMEISEPITLTDRLRDIKTEGLTPYTEKSFD